MAEKLAANPEAKAYTESTDPNSCPQRLWGSVWAPVEGSDPTRRHRVQLVEPLRQGPLFNFSF